MHIPSEMLSGSVCPVTAAIAAGGVAASVYLIYKNKDSMPSASKFAMVSAAVFGMQMLNYPIWHGISGHLIGGVFAAAMLGAPAAVLSLAIVLLLQTLLFADGGLLMLGANVLNMAILGAGAGGLIRSAMLRRSMPDKTATALAAFISVELAAVALCAELAFSGKGSAQAFLTLIGVHSALAAFEAAASVLLISLLDRSGEEVPAKRTLLALGALVIASVALSPFACAFPDAFEWTMQTFSMLPEAPNFANAPFAGYAIASLSNTALSGICAGAIGIVSTAAFAYVAARILCRRATVA